MALSIQIYKRVGAFTLDLALSAGDGAVGLLGASGSGKSMTLRAVAGLTRPDSGRIVLDGRALYDSARRVNLRPQARRAALLPQDYALFPNMTLLQNLRAGARREGTQARIPELLERFRLTPLADRYPAELSGGQRQRAALARCLLSKPDCLLLDEPFSALDAPLRALLEQELRQALREFGKTALLVSHDAGELFRLCGSLAVLENGHVDVSGPCAQVFAQPKTRAAAYLTGWKNISPARPLGAHQVLALDWNLPLSCAGDGDYVAVGNFRPGQSVKFQVLDAAPTPDTVRVLLRPTGAPDGAAPLLWDAPRSVWETCRGAEVSLAFDAVRLTG